MPDTETVENAPVNTVPIRPNKHETEWNDAAAKVAPPVKRGRGRPTKDQVAEREAAEAANLPDPRTDPFRMYLPKLSAADWKNHIGYLYRLAPITDRRATTGGSVWIGKYAETVDEGSIMREHGSGRYRFDLLWCPPGGGDNQYVFRHSFDILNPDFPPRIPAGEWVDDPRNRDWAWAKPSTPGQAPGGGGVSPNDLVEAVVKLTERTRPDLDDKEKQTFQNEIINLVRDNQAQMRDLMDPQKQLTAFIGLMNLMRPPNSDQPDPMLTFLMDERKDHREEMRLLRERIDQRQEPKPFLEQLREFSSAKKDLADTLGLSEKKNGKDDNFWGEVIRDCVSELAPIGRVIAEALVKRASNGWKPSVNMRDNHPGRQPQNAIERRRALKTAEPGAPHDRPAETAAATEPNDEPIEGASELFNGLAREEKEKVFQLAQKYGQLLMQCRPFLVDHFRNGLSGYDFRDWFLSRNGSNWYVELKKDTNTEQLINFVKFEEELYKALQPEPALLKFFREFFTDPGAEPKDSEYYLRTHDDDDPTEEPPPDDPAR